MCAGSADQILRMFLEILEHSVNIHISENKMIKNEAKNVHATLFQL